MNYVDPKRLEHEMHVLCFGLITLSLIVIGLFLYLRPDVTGLSVYEPGLVGLPSGQLVFGGKGFDKMASNPPPTGGGSTVDASPDLGSDQDSEFDPDLDHDPDHARESDLEPDLVGFGYDGRQASPMQAEEAFGKAVSAVAELNQEGISRYYFQDLLLGANQSILKNSTEAFLLSRNIVLKKLEVVELRDGLRNVHQERVLLQEKGVNITAALEMLTSAQDEFDAERFGEAASLLSSALQELARSRQEFEKISMIKKQGSSFFRSYGPVLIVGLAVLLVLCIPIARTILRLESSNKGPDYAKDLSALESLMKKTKQEYGSRAEGSSHNKPRRG